jgi:hypothetical protein
MILLWGTPTDSTLAAVERILVRERIPHVFLDQRAILKTRLELVAGENVRGTLRVQDDQVDLSKVRAVYARPLDPCQFDFITKAGPQSTEWRHAATLHEAMSIWLDLTPALVLNRPAEMALNYSKPNQAVIIQKRFKIPETLITTDSEAVMEFKQAHTAIVYKSVSSLRSVVSQFQTHDEQRLASVVWCPTQFQRRISGTEVRVHVVGEQIFAAEIRTEADDYRYAALTNNTVQIQPCELPQDCSNACRSLVRSMNYLIAGIDLRLENGTWYCFEVNPSPAFMYYQQHTGQRIDEAVVQLLRAGSV